MNFAVIIDIFSFCLKKLFQFLVTAMLSGVCMLHSSQVMAKTETLSSGKKIAVQNDSLYNMEGEKE